MPRRSLDGMPRFVLRHDAGPVWSLSRGVRRRGIRWQRIETPGGPGFADAAHLRDVSDISDGAA